MDRRDLIKATAAASLAAMAPKATPGVSPAPLADNRFLTLSIPIRTTPWEVSRDVKLIDLDESPIHTLENVRALGDAFRSACPLGRLTWSFTLNALEDQRTNYREIRDYVVQCHQTYGDEVTYFPGYFPAMYLPRQRVNREIGEALDLVSNLVGGGYRPQSIIGGFLSAENMRYLAEDEGIHAAVGVIWSQYGVDAGDADGSPSYPYYPSREHICKPAQNQRGVGQKFGSDCGAGFQPAPGPAQDAGWKPAPQSGHRLTQISDAHQNQTDFIDCVNLDGWTMDFICARRYGNFGQGKFGYNSRRGLGPIETYGALGLKTGQREVMHTQAVHFDRGFELNGFAWVTSIWEAALVGQYSGKKYPPNLMADAMNLWISETMERWPNTRIVGFGEFGETWRRHYQNNGPMDYRFEATGSGIADSNRHTHVRWFMNQSFRLALISDLRLPLRERVLDFTRYDLPALEPPDPSPDHPQRNWSLINRINQKRLRPQDRPIPLSRLTAEEKQLIARYYPELF